MTEKSSWTHPLHTTQASIDKIFLYLSHNSELSLEDEGMQEAEKRSFISFWKENTAIQSWAVFRQVSFAESSALLCWRLQRRKGSGRGFKRSAWEGFQHRNIEKGKFLLMAKWWAWNSFAHWNNEKEKWSSMHRTQYTDFTCENNTNQSNEVEKWKLWRKK